MIDCFIERRFRERQVKKITQEQKVVYRYRFIGHIESPKFLAKKNATQLYIG